MVTTWKKFKEIIIHRKGLGIIGFSDILGTIISSIFWIFIASVIKPDEYGEIFYFIAIVSMAFNLSTIGTLDTNIVFSAKGKQLESTLNTVSLLFGVVSSLILMILFYKIDIIILLFGYIINILSLGYLIGKRLYSKYAIFLLSQKILTVIIGISFFYIFGADGIISALGISYMGFLIIIFNSYRKSPLKFKEFKNNFTFIWQNYSVKFVGVFKENIDKLIIVPLIGFTYLGSYVLALQFIGILAIPNLIFYKYLLTNDSRAIPNRTLKKYYILTTVCIAISGSIFLPTVAQYFFPQFTDLSILRIMSFNVIPVAISSVRISELLGSEKSKPFVISALIATAIVIPGMLLLVPQIGITGAVIVSLLAVSSQAAYLTFYGKTWKKGVTDLFGSKMN